MPRIRVFIALELSSSVLGKATEMIRVLRGSGAEVNWVNPRQLHLTLKFLGDVPETETPEICNVVAQAAQAIEPFEISFRGLGAFPSLAKPRTLWLGLAEGQEALAELNTAIETALYQELGYPLERQRFTPHLTLGRVRPSLAEAEESLRSLIESHAQYDADLTVVEEAVVFASYPRAGGFEYNALGRAPLAE